MIYDVSPLVDESVAVWPGDTPFSARDLLRLEEGASVHLSTITLSCHTGAHADAPCHTARGAPGIDGVALERYLGPCALVDVRPRDGVIRLSDLDEAAVAGAPRILFRTREKADRTKFPASFASLDPGLVDVLGRRGVVLVGLDTPSVDRFDSKELPSHHALLRHGIASLECLELTGVPPGRYELIALPLKLRARDASPVRAVLRSLGSGSGLDDRGIA
ncbi:MAG: cyclase family protein [Planctomycetaceae bacterium]